MKSVKSFNLDDNTFRELEKIARITGTNKSNIVNTALDKAIEEIKALNCNYSEFIKKNV